MKASIILTSAAIVTAFATVIWTRTSLQERIRAIESRQLTISAGMDPIHTRCEVLEGLLGAAQEDLAQVREGSTALGALVAGQAALASENREQLDRIGARLVETREDATRRSAELLAALERHVRDTDSAEAEAAEIARRFDSLEGRLESLPAGSILP